MKLNPLLDEAVEVFKILRWDEAAWEDAPHLPLGTSQQQRLAVNGLKSGDWGEYAPIGDHTFGWISAHSVDDRMLALFALRCGVSAKRAQRLITTDDEVTFECITQRGMNYVTQFLDHYYRGPRRMHELALSSLGSLGVSLALYSNNAPLLNSEYLRDWAVIALHALTGDNRYMYADYPKLPALEELTSTFNEHVYAAVNNGVSPSGPFREILDYATQRGVLAREDALEACINGFDAAIRPGDRKSYTQLLLDSFQITESELLSQREVFMNSLSTGEAPVVEAFAPMLIKALDSTEVADAALTALYAKTAKSRLQVLRALERRSDFQDSDASALADRLSEIANSRDKAAARIAKNLLTTWGISHTTHELSTPRYQRLWQPTPPLWEVPTFELGEVSVKALAHAINHLRATDRYRFDIEGDRILALAVELARTDVEQVRRAFNGVKNSLWPPLVRLWAETNDVKYCPDSPLSHAQMVFANLGSIPCLLSTPSRLDSSVALKDVADRLSLYAQVQAGVLETDLALSLFRLSPRELSDLKNLPSLPAGVPVILVDGQTLDRDAARVIGDYLADPLREGSIEEKCGWLRPTVAIPQSLSGLQLTTRLNRMIADTPRLVPHSGAYTFRGLSWSRRYLTDAGLWADDASYSAQPLPPEAAINLLGVQRPVHPKMAELCAQGLVKAWERGLLLPGAADIRYLDWTGELTDLRSFAQALHDVAQLGILSVVWPVLDDLLVAAVRAPRLPAGTSDIAHVMESLVHEVLVAVDTGVADASAREVPGIRALASRNGTSKAVETARAVVAQLPEATVPVDVAERVGMSSSEFELMWQPVPGLVPLPEDGSRICGFDEENAAPNDPLPVIFELREYAGERFIFRERSVNSPPYNQQLPVDRISQDGARTSGYIHWDGTRLVFRDRILQPGDKDYASVGQSKAYSQLMMKIHFAYLVAPYGVDYTRGLTRDMVKQGLIDSATVQTAVHELLPFKQWSPARAVYLLESQPELLVELWPMLSEPLSYAATQTQLPRWINRVLDVSLLHSHLLRQATLRGYIPMRAWSGVTSIAQRNAKSAAMSKAGSLVTALDLLGE